MQKVLLPTYLLLHGIGGDAEKGELPVVTKDALTSKHGEHDMVLANLLFGKLHDY